MPILNYTTSIAASKTAGEVQGLLAAHGARQIVTEFADGGEITGMKFSMRTEFGERGFSMPVRTDGVLAAMTADKSIPRSKCSREQAQRVAWRIAKDWLAVQLALIDAGLASLEEVMLPYMLGSGGHTAFETYRETQLAITSGKGQDDE
jgi:hypothetical protein